MCLVSRSLASHCSPRRFVVMKCKWSLISRWIPCSLNTRSMTSGEREHMLRLEVQRQSGVCDGGMWQTGLSGAYSSASLTYILPDCYSPRWHRRKPETALTTKNVQQNISQIGGNWADCSTKRPHALFLNIAQKWGKTRYESVYYCCIIITQRVIERGERTSLTANPHRVYLEWKLLCC